MTERHTASSSVPVRASREPQKPALKKLLYEKLAKLQAWRDDHREHERFRAACDIAVEDLKEIIILASASPSDDGARQPQNAKEKNMTPKNEQPWDNPNVAVVDEQCPIHGDNADGNCWPCHVAAVYADPESCEPIE